MRPSLMAIAAAGLLGLSACGEADAPERLSADATVTVQNGTIAASLGDIGELRTVSAALADTQLAPVLDGNGDYTLLAPTDAAFTALGDKAEALRRANNRPLMIAVLRGHILPGQVTTDSIKAAIARKKGSVTMQTMGGTSVTFIENGEDITVGNGASTATIGQSATASNGAILTIDKVLVPAA